MTIKDLAKETGYSLGTVSRVLNNHPNVSEKARVTIMEAVERHGFMLNTSAKNLKQQQSETICCIVKGSSNELFANLLEYMQALFSNTRYTLITDFIDEDDNEVLHARQVCLDMKPQGLLFLGGNQKNFEEGFDKIKLPSVLVTSGAEELFFENLSSVTTDDCGGACCAVDYLLTCGHKNIAVIGGYVASDTSCLRLKGYELAHERRGIEKKDRGPHVGGRYSYESGYNAMWKLLQEEVKPTAVFAMADVMAIGAIRAINDYGLKVPEDISVVGFDGIQIGEYYCPKLTTIVQNVEVIATRSFERIVACIEEGACAGHDKIAFKLEKKESVKAIISPK